MQPSSSGDVVAVTNLAEFFRDSLRGAVAEQRFTLEEQTESYVVNLLTLFVRAERLYESADSPRMRPLAEMFGEALRAATAAKRDLALQRLGDVSLFVAGFLARGFARRLVDVDYHIAMGSSAYGTLARPLERGRPRASARVFSELAAKFRLLVDSLGEISDAAYVYTQRDILRLYEIWLKTGSARARRLLRRLGVEPAPIPALTH